MGNQDDSSTSKPVKSLNSTVRVICDFTDTITIRVRDKYFKVPRDLLTATSVFFDEELSYSTPKKFFLVLDDIDADLFNTYINVLFKSAFSPGFRLRSHNVPSVASSTAYIKFLLRLWQLSRRLNSFRMCLLAEEALTSQYFAKFTAKQWEVAYVKCTEAHMRQRLLALQKCYTLCKNESIPFEEEFVTACAKCPGQMVATYFDHLEPGFRAEVVKTFAFRIADPGVTEKKRAREDGDESKTLKKRRC
ncbi:hypothetical protein LA080_004692 [Diaporthe eres]|nr:hypothetical protein LA080_004692 [Diaporthe eres]